MTDPNQLFSIATSNVVAGYNTEAEVRTAVFSNIALARGNSGTDTTGISSATADLNTVATTNTLALRIMGIQDDVDNADFTARWYPFNRSYQQPLQCANWLHCSGYCFNNWRIGD